MYRYPIANGLSGFANTSAYDDASGVGSIWESPGEYEAYEGHSIPSYDIIDADRLWSANFDFVPTWEPIDYCTCPESPEEQGGPAIQSSPAFGLFNNGQVRCEPSPIGELPWRSCIPESARKKAKQNTLKLGNDLQRLQNLRDLQLPETPDEDQLEGAFEMFTCQDSHKDLRSHSLTEAVCYKDEEEECTPARACHFGSRAQNDESSLYRPVYGEGPATTLPHDHAMNTEMLGRRFECAFCEKTFSTAGHRSRHQRIHLGVKPFVCPSGSCGKAFSRRDNMRQVGRSMH
ncbi:hypothetical protein BC832DRAFT_460123 [Gaertneriomyces semiglobifer]|nr:hypothetical protein BC832DRAFT_460123 [Gaertneriomyces semiglobifer]